MMSTMPAFLDTQRLREVYRAAVVYEQATGNVTLRDALKVALDEAERHEPSDAYGACLVCGDRVLKGRHYCGFDCAETDGAVEK